MKLHILSTFLLLTFFGISQNNFIEIPGVPNNPIPGSVAPNAATVLMSDEGKVYSAYIQFDGTDHYLMIEQYTAGGWMQLFQETIYAGFQPIKGHKLGNDIYFSVKTDNLSSQDIMKVYRISGGNIIELSATLFGNYASNTLYDFTISTSASYAYFLHKDNSAANLMLTQVDLVGLSSNELMIPLGAADANHFDMVERFDTVYIAINAFETSHNLYLMKVSSDMGTAVTYDNSALGIIPGTNTAVSQEVMIAYNSIPNNISITTRANGSNQRFTYTIFGSGLSQNTSSFVPVNMHPPVTLSESNGLYHFGLMDNGTGLAQNLMVIKENLTTFETDTIGNFLFNGIADDAFYYSIGYAAASDRVAVSYHDTLINKRRYFLTNNAPEVDPGTISIANICNNMYDIIYSNIGILELDNDQINIVSITSNNTAACDASNVYYNILQQTGNTQNFQLYGQVGTSGTFALTITFTDGIDTVQYTLPPVTINNPGTPQWVDDTLHICSGNGIINFHDYVTPAGGSFFSNTLEESFPNGVLDTDNNPFSFEQAEVLTYDVTVNGCWTTSDVVVILHNGPTVTVSTTASSCGGATGSANATVVGGLTPYNYQLWSTGALNVSAVTNLAAGQYTYTLEDGNACQKTVIFDIGVSGADATAVIQDVLCFGQNNGSITLTPTGLIAPISYLWSSGHSTASISNLSAGSYTVQISDAANCVFTKTFNVAQPDKLAAEMSFYQPNCGLADGTMEVYDIVGGVAPYSVNWSNGDNGLIVNNIPFGVYSATITDQNGCQAIKTFYMSESNSADLYGTITPTNCGSNNGAIDVSPWVPGIDPIESIQWSNGATTEDISNLAPANYICTLTVANTGCRAIKGWNIPIVNPEMQPICVVTVDSATTTNLVVWEPVQPVGIAYYNIYRETSTPGEYIKIDTVQATNLSIFNDVVASPLVRSWSYRISAVNGCEVEGPISVAHRTIHLNVVDLGTDVQISWNNYEGTTDYDDQKLWRYTDANGWENIATLPVNAITYTDAVAFSEPGLDYMVELELNNQCTAVIYKAQDFNTTRSNKDKGAFSAGQGTGDSNNSIDETYMSAIELYPNPASDQVILAQTMEVEMSVKILTLSGHVVAQTSTSALTSVLAIDQLAAGTYLVEMRIGERTETRRLVKQ